MHLGLVGDMRLPTRIQEAMQTQVEAERKKRAAVLESEGQWMLNYFVYDEHLCHSDLTPAKLVFRLRFLTESLCGNFCGDTKYYLYCICCNAGIREAEINIAEGKKRARILISEAYLTEQVNQAKGFR